MRTVPSWSKYFMQVAKTISIRSKDPNTQVGCLIVDKNNHIIGHGYNGFVPGALETAELWERPTKYGLVVHAEQNALLNAAKSPRGATLYTTLFPCLECAKAIVAAGIQKVIYLDDKSKTKESEELLKSNSKLVLVKLKE